MAWTNSKIHAAVVHGILDETITGYDMDGETWKAALYNNTGTPDAGAALANTVYAVDQWVVANEVDDGTDWDTGGEPITTRDLTLAAAVITLDGDDTPQGGTTTTLASVFGCLVYNDTHATKYGFCFNYFGGTQSVTAGTFTIVWNASGIATLTLT